MKKRKILSLVTVGFVLLYLLSALTFAFMSWNLSEDEEMRTGSSYSLQMQEDVHSFLENLEDGQTYTEEDFNRLLYNMSYLYGTDYPTLFALVDNKTGEVVARSKNIVHFYDFDTEVYVYVDIEPYLTNEIKEELADIKKELKSDHINLSKMSFAIENDKYIPVEMTVRTGRMEDYKTVKITDYESDITLSVLDDFLAYHSYNLQQKGYTAKLYKMMELQLENELSEMRNTNIPLSGQSSYFGIGNRGYNSTINCVSGTGYEHYTCIFIGPAYNEYVETFTNEYFVASMIVQGILFVIAYLIAIRVALKLYKKNEQMTRAQRTFTSAAAHELKTPLAVIQNQCECVMENVAPEKNDEYIKSVYDEAVRMNGIVTNLLQYNRLVNTEKLQKEKCDLTEIILAETEKYKTFAETSGAELQVKVASDKCEINCNRDLISMAVDNFLSNAIKYATGDKRVVVQLVGRRVSVFNTCDGISAEMQKDLWNLLSRGSKARTKDGSSSGMGLPICAEIFKAHGYEYGCRNVRDGVEFYFQIK